MSQKVITVLGPISPEKMGITDAHSHLWISPLKGIGGNVPVLDQEKLILEDITAYKSAGGLSQIDCQPGGAGRDGNRLRSLSKGSGVNVVSCTGFHLSDYYPEDANLWKLDPNQAAAFFLSEIKEGLEETRKIVPVYPGFIKIAVRESVKQSPVKLIKAAVTASLESGYTIEMHTEKGAEVEKFLDMISKLGLPLERLVICHIDKRPDLGLHQELAEAGCMLEYDTFFRPKYHPEKYLWKLIPEMVNSGYHKSVALATDLADKNLWENMGGGPGLAGFIKKIKKRLEIEITEEPIIKDLMGGNINRCLAVNIEE